MQVSFSILRANGEAGKVYTADGDVIAFGRSDECNVELNDAYVSSRHAEIRYVDGLFYLQDLKSTNGTWIKEDRVEGQIPIQDDVVIEFGKGGPKVLLVTLIQPGAKAAFVPAQGANNAQVSQPANVVNTAATRAKPRNSGFPVISCIVVGCLAVACGAVFVPPFLANHKPEPILPASEVVPPNPVADPIDDLVPTELTAPPSPMVNFEEIAESVRDQSVWIGLTVHAEGQDLTYPLCSGWCYSSHQIITTGTLAAEFLSSGESLTLVVYSRRLAENTPHVKVKRIVIHPGFNVSDPESPASIENNLGMLELAQPLPVSAAEQHQAASVDEWKLSLKDAGTKQLIQCGYSISLEPEPITALATPGNSWSHISVGQSIPGSSQKLLPLIRVSFEKTQSTTRGNLVLNSAGKIMGTLQHLDETNAILIPIDRIPQLLSSAVSHAL